LTQNEIIEKLSELQLIGSRSLKDQTLNGKAKAILKQDRKSRCLCNEIVFKALCNWVEKYQLPEADSALVRSALEEAKRAGSDLTLGESKWKIEHAGDHDEPWNQIGSAIDWNAISYRKQLTNEAIEASEIVKSALLNELVSAREIGLYRRP
jgi:hypothetical protein